MIRFLDKFRVVPTVQFGTIDYIIEWTEPDPTVRMLKETGDGYHNKMPIYYLRSNSQRYKWQYIYYVFHRLVKRVKS